MSGVFEFDPLNKYAGLVKTLLATFAILGRHHVPDSTLLRSKEVAVLFLSIASNLYSNHNHAEFDVAIAESRVVSLAHGNLGLDRAGSIPQDACLVD
jgi:hypothetical protein